MNGLAHPWHYGFAPPYSHDWRFPPNYPAYAKPAWPQLAATPWLEKQLPLTFVLIHGAWADAGFWDGIAAELRAMGHTVHVPEYPGHGPDSNNAVTHAMMTESLADYIRRNDLRDIVLVGHSFGGTLIQKTAELVPERIKRLVFLNAFVLNDGQSVADEFPPQALQLFDLLRRSSQDDTIMLPFALFRETFVNLASLGLAERIYRGISPEPAGPSYEKLDLKKFYALDMPRSYVYLTEDNVLPLGSSEYGWHPHMSSRLGLFRFIQGGGDHMSTAMTEPRMVAQKLYSAGRD
ncbi:alpha/beta fold hydrolase [Paenibacillus sp. IB182493]|uniref:Alpha/beta fold hydrolase n=2 Tax=Paenibacillus arenilitoris TaxID=2772299 RepID=A0A927H5Y3_9BACL|nr:alpha/beta fold hydrolase [Paenibacillus arenilitoris]